VRIGARHLARHDLVGLSGFAVEVEDELVPGRQPPDPVAGHGPSQWGRVPPWLETHSSIGGRSKLTPTNTEPTALNTV